MSKKTSSWFGMLRKALVGGAIVKFLTSDDDRREEKSSGLGKKLVIGGLLGAVAYLLFEPNRGRERRGKLMGLVSKAKQRAAPAKARSSSDDAVLEARIESEILSRGRYPKGQINLDVVDGVVTLRGQLDATEQIAALEQEVRKMTGVVEVRNFLHLPDETPPNKEAALRAGE